ncbi:hypothetical protein HDC94_001075 [Leifsonia sp. AK011]|uniref:TylF/MycF/NovP-related O-methyltransferase n=1 Tax=Leifsonia sp. AK011 TaxID=2723075 RepID=UPI0015CBC981|nr:TylF/MycF/NovP-related O-methyltransferase [Leifsonia sp. AK011]NYF09919.1 hypothetical protein [Leifsonia sp. AK011]
MRDEDFAKLVEDVEEQLDHGVFDFGLLGNGATVRRAKRWFSWAAPQAIATVYGDEPPGERPLASLAVDQPPVLIVAVDESKERVLERALPHVVYAPKVIVAGYAHYDFRDDRFEDLHSQLLVPSIANGYPNTLVHLYQCLVNADRLGLEGSIAEFGVFKGGTTMFLARLAAELGREWPLIGFDTFGGFPSKRSALDMYHHPGAEFRDFAAVERYLSAVNVELVKGDIVETANRLTGTPLVLTFIDTDNFSSAQAAVAVVAEETVVGGAIVFDHYTGVDRFRYTLGERMAARPLVEDVRYFNLHATGVFLRQK